MIMPDEYRSLGEAEFKRRIASAKQKLGSDLAILGHYYQRDEVVEFADHEGDSFELSRFGASTPATHIVFCGVRFMAEAARILASERQRVYLPNLEAGCPLSDMADIEHVESAWKVMEHAGATSNLLPIVYVNSSAELKAFCGSHGGTICTSSSAAKAFAWAEAQGRRVFFLPDMNLGLDTSIARDIRRGEIAIWDSLAADYESQVDAAKDARAIVWKGYCHVHTFFTAEQIAEARKNYPGCRVVVHPECVPEVVALSDANGSTSFIKEYAENAPAGSSIIIGTEINFVNRIARKNSDKVILPLARSLCPNMFRTSLADLCFTLERIGEVNEIAVPATVKGEARLALDRMLALK
jgi:quinolinate synthase